MPLPSTIDLPISATTAIVDANALAQAVAPYVAGLLQPGQGGVFRAIHQELVQPSTSGIAPSPGDNGVFTAVPGFAIERTLQAGSKALIQVDGIVATDFSIADIIRTTLLRKVGSDPWVDVRPAGLEGLDVPRPPNSSEPRPFRIIFLDDAINLTESASVTYQLAVRSNNGNVWVGRRYDNAMRSGTTFTLHEIAGLP